MSERPTQSRISQQIKSAKEHVANWPEDVKKAMQINDALLPTQNEIDEANSSHSQDVEERRVLAELIEHYQIVCHADLPMSGGEAIHEFASKLRAKDAATIAQWKERCERRVLDIQEQSKRHHAEIASLKAQLSTEQGKIAILKDQYRSLQRSHHVLVTHHLAVEAQLAEAQNKTDLLCDSSYIAGMKFGWNCAETGDQKQFTAAIESRIKERSAAPIYKKED